MYFNFKIYFRIYYDFIIYFQIETPLILHMIKNYIILKQNRNKIYKNILY